MCCLMFTGTSRKTDGEEKKRVFNGKPETVQIYLFGSLLHKTQYEIECITSTCGHLQKVVYFSIH